MRVLRVVVGACSNFGDLEQLPNKRGKEQIIEITRLHVIEETRKKLARILF